MDVEEAAGSDPQSPDSSFPDQEDALWSEGIDLELYAAATAAVSYLPDSAGQLKAAFPRAGMLGEVVRVGQGSKGPDKRLGF